MRVSCMGALIILFIMALCAPDVNNKSMYAQFTCFIMNKL